MRLWLAALLTLALAAPASAATAKRPWPPAAGPGQLFAHYGEEHHNDADGPTILPKVVEDVARYDPALVTMSGDKGSDGTTEQLTAWRNVMSAYDRAGVPYLAALGNHDGKQETPEAVTEAAAGATPLRNIEFYTQVFAERPYPMGDAKPYDDPLMSPKERPAGDPDGAATHYFADYGNVRWIFLDNSCYGIVNCDPLQNPPDGEGRSQYEYLRAQATEAAQQGKLVFVVMHMPTRDIADQSYREYSAFNHVMGKGISPDNQTFEQEAEALGVDAVFLGHIKGQFIYRGRGNIPYYIDGGAGGELYTRGPIGTDHGYWHGYRLIRVDGNDVETDAVPIFVPGGLRLDGPERLPAGGGAARYEAFGRQPVFNDPAKVEALELRDPDPVPRDSGAVVPPWMVWLAPLLLVPAVALVPRRRLVAVPAVAVAVLGAGAVASAQRSEPTSTPKEALPNPARIFTSQRPLVLAPVASDSDDPRRNPRTQTADGAFAPRCPGRTRLTVTSGWEETARTVTVASRRGRIVRSIRRRGRRIRVRLAQPAIVQVRRRKRACLPAGRHTFRVRRGAVRLRVLSDRKPVTRRWRIR